MLLSAFLLVVAAPATSDLTPNEFHALLAEMSQREFWQIEREVRIEHCTQVLEQAAPLAELEDTTIGNKAAFVLVRLAKDLMQADRVVPALDLLQSGINHWQGSCNLSWNATLTLTEAEALQWLGVLDQADRRFEDALRLFEEARAQGDHLVEAQGYFNIAGYFNAHFGSIQYKLNTFQFESALAQIDDFEGQLDWDQIASRISPVRVERNRGKLLLLRGEALLRLGPDHWEEAIHVFETLLELQSLLPEVRAWALASLVKLHHQDDEADLAQFFADRLHETVTELPRSSESIYVELYLGAVRSMSASDHATGYTELREAVDRFLQMVRSNERAAGTGAAMFDSFSLAREALLEAANSDVERIELLLELGSAGRVWRALGQPQPRADDLLELLATTCGVALFYQRGSVRDYWVVIEPAGRVEQIEVPRFATWAAQASEFQLLLGQTTSDIAPSRRRRRIQRLEELGRSLSETLFPLALRTRLEAHDAIFLAGRDNIAGLSIEALPLAGQTFPLGCTYALREVPALAVASELGRRATARAEGDSIRLVADARAAPSVCARYGIPATLGIERERIIAELDLPTKQVAHVAVGGSATRAQLRSTADQQVLHLITHGVRDRSRELAMMLALTPNADDDGLMGIDAIRGTSTSALVLLSVCSGAEAATRSGDAGANHLGGAFIEAGADTVVLSSGSVQLDATLTFYRAFYASVLQGTGAAEAATDARRALFQNERFSDPYHWGQIRVFGSGD